MKKFRKAVALLLVVCMLTSGNMSLFANAAESNSVSEIGTDMFYRVFHLDAARKYFSAAEIKELIKIAADGGYNQFELYLADNQGFRFALENMEVIANGKTYDLEPALGKGYSAAPHYTDGVDKWLTEDEMDDIIAYANSKGIGIVPCINAPGHMGTILEGVKDQISNLQYSTTINGEKVTSKSALNLENEEAYAFGLALIEKYATYFASKGIKYLNIGADEYAADLTDLTTGENNGMDLLYNAGGYLRFVDFVNDAATIIKELEMTPRAYNDCIYYNNSDTYSEGQYTNEPVLFDKDIEICYWNGAWTWGDTTGDDVPDWFRRADATYLANKGFKMINANGSYYHVLGTGGETGDNRQIETATSVQSFDINNFHTFANANKYVEISNPAGAMFCIWCDNATNDLDEVAYTGPASWVIENSRDAIIAFGQNVLSQKAPTTKTVDLKVGETYTETFKGRPTVAYEAMDPTIAEQTTTVNEGESIKSVGKVVAMDDPFNSGEYYLEYNGQYLIVQDGQFAMVNADGAIPWNIAISSTATDPEVSGYNRKYVTITQNGYYLSNQVSNGALEYIPSYSMPQYGFIFDGANELYVSATDVHTYRQYVRWMDTKVGGENWTNNGIIYFRPFTVETTTITPTTTTITFTGEKVGTTYAYIGDVEYTINVTSDEEVDPEDPADPKPEEHVVIDLKVGETLEWDGLIEGAYNGKHSTTDDTIATVIGASGENKVTESVGVLKTDSKQDGRYYLGNANGKFLVVENGTWTVVDKENAKAWDITLTVWPIAITQEGKRLGSEQEGYGFGFNIYDESNHTQYYPLRFQGENNNALSVEFEGNPLYTKWNDTDKKLVGEGNETNEIFRLYTVETETTPTTVVTFEGKKEGTTEVTIGNVTFEINVTMEKKTIEVVEGESAEVIVDKVITGNYSTAHPHIATVTVAPYADATMYEVGGLVTETNLPTGKYYLGMNGQYLIVKDGQFAMVGPEEAIPWDVTITSTMTDDLAGGTISVVTMKQNGYYFNDQSTDSEIVINPSTSIPTKSPRIDGVNELYISWNGYRHYVRWMDGKVGAEGYVEGTVYFQPYEAVEKLVPAKTAITFEGKKEGETQVIIGGVNYTIIVTENTSLNTVPITLSVNEIKPVTVEGDVSGVWETDNTDIATVITTLVNGEEKKTVGEAWIDTVITGEYFIGIGDKYLVVDDQGWPRMYEAADAIPWKVTTTAEGVVIQQGDYYLANFYDEDDGLQCVTRPGEAAAFSYKFDKANGNALYFTYEGANYYADWQVSTEYGYIGYTQTSPSGTSLKPYKVNTSTGAETILNFYGYAVGETEVVIGNTRYIITVEEENTKPIDVTIPIGEEVVLKQTLEATTVTPSENDYVDINLEYRRQDGFSWVANPQANYSYYIMGIEQHYLAIEDGKLITVEEPTADQKWTVIPKKDGFSLKYGDYYLVNHWHDGKMTLEFLEEDTSAFPWQFDQNRGIYCTDKVETYRLAHNPLSHQWELNNLTTRRIGFSEVNINEGTNATEITFAGKKVTTEPISVIIGSKTYNITVTPAGTPDMEEVTIEYWITNNRCVNTDDDETTNEFYGDDRYQISYDDSEVANEKGMMIADWVAKTAARLSQNTNVVQDEELFFWKTSVNADGFEQEEGFEAKTTSGTFFDRIRFWNGKWSVSGDGEAWRILESTDQLVAYYIQKTDVTTEVTTYAMDWGLDNATNGGYTCIEGDKDYSYVLLDFAVKYESGTRVPNEFPRTETIGFHCDHADVYVAKAVAQDEDGDWYRKLGVIQAEAKNGLEVYMITLTPHTDNKKATLSDLGTNPLGVTYSYDDGDETEKVVWVDDEANLGIFADPSLQADGYHVGGDNPYVPEIVIYEHQAMLVTYYVRAVPLESALEVHYHDATGVTGNLAAAPEFYMYNISVKEGTVFPDTIKDVNGKLTGATVENFVERIETVTSDLSAMPAIPVQYRYGEYEYLKFSLSEDKTQLHLYYVSDEPIYVVDFGLPVNVELGLKENATAEILAQPTFGTAVIKDGILTYEPTKVILTIDSVVVKITEAGNAEGAINTYRFYPATTVYYEEGFMNIAGSSWGEAGTALSNEQTTTLLGQYQENDGYNYGYDESYSSQVNGPSNGTYLVSTNPSGYAEFTFTGTGVDIYANCTPDSGSINVLVRNSAGKLVKMLQINTKMAASVDENGNEGSATGGQKVNAFNIPVASIDFGTTHDTYTVQIRHIKTVVSNEAVFSPVQLDGFRVYNTLSDSNVYKDDFEANPTFVEVRDMLFNGFSIDEIVDAVGKDENTPSSGSDYFEDYTADQLGKAMTQVLNLSGGASKTTAVIIDKKNHDKGYVQDLLDNGPKNEVYLFEGQSLVFTPANEIDMQVGLKAIDKAVNTTIAIGADEAESKTITTSTDMFYELGSMTGETVTITNVSGGILSITDLKWIPSDGTSAASDEAFMTLTEADFVTTFKLMGFRSSTPDPEPEPEVEETILYQTNANSTDVRLIAYLDDLAAYSKVAFTLTIDGRTSKELECTAAYTELYAGGELYTTEDIYGVDGYFVTFTINRYLEVYAGKEVTITVTYTTVTGETVTAERTVTIE